MVRRSSLCVLCPVFCIVMHIIPKGQGCCVWQLSHQRTPSNLVSAAIGIENEVFRLEARPRSEGRFSICMLVCLKVKALFLALRRWLSDYSKCSPWHPMPLQGF